VTRELYTHVASRNRGCPTLVGTGKRSTMQSKSWVWTFGHPWLGMLACCSICRKMQRARAVCAPVFLRGWETGLCYPKFDLLEFAISGKLQESTYVVLLSTSLPRRTAKRSCSLPVPGPQAPIFFFRRTAPYGRFIIRHQQSSDKLVGLSKQVTILNNDLL
jgi:hypothetical protein